MVELDSRVVLEESAQLLANCACRHPPFFVTVNMLSLWDHLNKVVSALLQMNSGAVRLKCKSNPSQRTNKPNVIIIHNGKSAI